MVTHFNILAWRIPWTEEPGELQSAGSQRVAHDLTCTCRRGKQYTLMHGDIERCEAIKF